MKSLITTLILAAALPVTAAGKFSRKTAFGSVKDFVAAAAAFEPATFKSDLADLFIVPELGEPNTGRPVLPKSIESSVAVWSNDSQALVFVKAFPPTEATKSVTGVLFLIRRTGESWKISHSWQFTATGKDAGISAKLTAATGGGPDRLGEDGLPPVVTVTETQGGQGYSYELSASYVAKAGKLELLDLK